ncbi:transient receptor potential cation channel subfamily A member 1-like isoform X2 [Nematostella vectensis]|nr:transient receptor potential cation channel subfamily A member 1-like isoform X2 [Nematostella vectensis]
MTPLHVAAIQGDLEVFSMLVEKGANYKAVGTDDSTLIHLAVTAGNTEIAKAILQIAVDSSDQKFFVDSMDVEGNTALHVCAATNNMEMADILLSHGAQVDAMKEDLSTPLHVACKKGSMEVGRLLVEKGAALDKKNDKGETPLHMAACIGSFDALKFLLSKGVAIDERDFSHRTPFLSAVAAGRTENAMVLLEKGADITANECNMKNCLHLAVEGDNLDTLKTLLEHTGCEENLYTRDIQERVPLHYASESCNIKILEAIVAKQTRFAFQDENQKSPLHLACAAGRALHVEALTRAGLSTNERDEEGQSALHMAALSGFRKVVTQLLRYGADINARDSNRWTPLMCAAKTGSVKTCMELLQSGASIDDVNDQGDTALLIATAHGHGDLVLLLLDQGACAIHRNNSGLGVIEIAVKHDAVLTVINTSCSHGRFKEILEQDNHSMKLLIKHCPEAAKTVLDRGMVRPVDISPTDQSYWVKYDFRYLDPGPDDPAAIKGNRYFGPSTMVEYDRTDLLLHPLTQKLLDKKWSAFGRTAYHLSFLVYLLFTIFYTYFIVVERAVASFSPTADSANSTIRPFVKQPGINKVLPFIVLVFACCQLLKEIFQMLFQRGRYFTQFSNLIEWTLYGTAGAFMVPYVAPESWTKENLETLKNPYNLWIMGIISIFLCYMNLVLFLRRLHFVGLLVAMFLEVLKSVLKVMLVFAIFNLAFAIVFYVLFKEQGSFENVGFAYMKVFVMMIGELDYSGTFVDTIGAKSSSGNPTNPFPPVAIAFCFLLLIFLTIALMNLMVGIAVGDIEAIRRDATLKRLAMQVEFVAEIEERYPRFIARIIYHQNLTLYPNKKTCMSRFMDKLRTILSTVPEEIIQSVSDESADSANSKDQALRIKVAKSSKRLKALMTEVEAQGELLRAIAYKIDPKLARMMPSREPINVQIAEDDVDAKPDDIQSESCSADDIGEIRFAGHVNEKM